MTENFSASEINHLRTMTPGTRHRVHLNNAGAALMTTGVLSTVVDHLNLEADIGGYEAKAREVDRIEGVYRSVAHLLNADPSEIALAENATVAWQWAFYAQRFESGDRILTTTAEYAANYLSYLQVAKRTGAVLIGANSTMQLGFGAGLPQAQLREVQPGDTVALGKFRLSFIASRHSPTPWSDGVSVENILAPVVPPARAPAWREGQVWSILVEHGGGGRWLIEGSAGFVPGALAGRKVDTVFLGVGTLGKKDEAYRRAYWHETVKLTRARRVVPIHWDDFTLPLEQGLAATPYLIDDFGVVMADLQQRGKATGIEIQMPPLWQPFAP